MNDGEERPTKQSKHDKSLFNFDHQSGIIQLFVKMQDFRMGEVGRNILKSLAEITKQQIICDKFSHFTEGGRERHQSKTQKYSRKQSCNSSDIAKLLQNSSSTTHKSIKGRLEKDHFYFYDVPAPKFKKQASFQHSRNRMEKSGNYSQIQSCLDISDPYRTAVSSKAKRGNSNSSTCCSGKHPNKTNKSVGKGNPLQEMLIRSSLLLESYESKCKQLQKQNVEIRHKCEMLNRKIKRLSKSRPVDLIHVF